MKHPYARIVILKNQSLPGCYYHSRGNSLQRNISIKAFLMCCAPVSVESITPSLLKKKSTVNNCGQFSKESMSYEGMNGRLGVPMAVVIWAVWAIRYTKISSVYKWPVSQVLSLLNVNLFLGQVSFKQHTKPELRLSLRSCSRTLVFQGFRGFPVPMTRRRRRRRRTLRLRGLTVIFSVHGLCMG